MRFQKICIDHFGKLSGVTLEPESGLNLIYGANEEGKGEEARAFAALASVGGPRRRSVKHTQSRSLEQGPLCSCHHLQRVWEDDGLARVSLLH